MAVNASFALEAHYLGAARHTSFALEAHLTNSREASFAIECDLFATPSLSAHTPPVLQVANNTQSVRFKKPKL